MQEAPSTYDREGAKVHFQYQYTVFICECYKNVKKGLTRYDKYVIIHFVIEIERRKGGLL